MATHQHKVHSQLGRAAVQIFAANDRMNQVLIEHLDPAAWRAKPPGKARTIAAIFTHVHNVRCQVGQAYGSAPESSSHNSTARTAHRSRPARDWPRAPLAVRRCSRKRSAAVRAASRSFAETAGPGPGRLAWKCCATCFLTKPIIAGRCVCSRINSDSRCRTRWRAGFGIGRSCGKSVGRRAARATILEAEWRRAEFGRSWRPARRRIWKPA